jgi:hypothetical protein
MAVIANQADSKIKLVLDAGLDEDNNSITTSKTISNVKATVENEALFNLATSLTGLQSYDLTNLVRYDEYQLLEEV